jgi:hypothetical protein
MSDGVTNNNQNVSDLLLYQQYNNKPLNIKIRQDFIYYSIYLQIIPYVRTG